MAAKKRLKGPRPRAGEFERKLARRLSSGEPAGLVVFRSLRHAEVAAARGPELAERMLEQLEGLLRSGLRPGDLLGRLEPDALGLLIPGGLDAALQAALRHLRRLREGSRFPVAAGLAHSAGLRGGARALRESALKAARESGKDGGRLLRVRSGATARDLPVPASAPGLDPLSDTLGARYQRLVLLNRMSLELFSEKPFPEALAEAASVILALTGAKFASVYFVDDLGKPFNACRQGDPLFAEGGARDGESGPLARCLAERRVVESAGQGRAWLAAPLRTAARAASGGDGALVLGFLGTPAAGIERERTLIEAVRLLRNARIIQKDLEERRAMAAVTEQSADAIFVTDLDHRIIRWNPSAAELFGHPAEEVLGRTPEFLVPDDKLEEEGQLQAGALARGPAGRFETVRRRRDGSLVPVEGRYTPLRDDSGRAFGVVRVFHDITKRKEVERMKTEFVSLVSHELRTPLTAIRGFAETIIDFWDQLPVDKRRHYLGIILDESKRLGNLVTDFLDISKLEAGGVEITPKRVRLPDLAGRLSALFDGHRSQALFKTGFEPGAEEAWADEEQLYRVLVNLCGNALKYSPAGGAVTIASRRCDDAVEVSVSDQGPGISRDDQGRIFEKFYRVADAVAKKTPGTGLGLAISKGIVESHGGRIWVDSGPGKGTAFRFTLPDQPARPPA